MAKVKVKLNHAGMRALLSSSEVRDGLMDVARSRVPAGKGYEARPGSLGGNRTRAFIAATDWSSYNDNARNASLLRAISGGG